MFIQRIKDFLYNRQLKFDIMTGFVALLIISKLSIIGYSYINNRDSMMSISSKFMEEVSQKMIIKNFDYLKSTARASQISKGMVLTPQEISPQNETLIAYMANVLDEYMHLDSVYMGSEQGNFLYVERRKPHKKYYLKNKEDEFVPGNIKYVVEFFDRVEKEPQHLFLYLNEDKQLVFTEKDADMSFDHRERPWYTSVARRRHFTWSDLYIFDIINSPGITASVPLQQKGKGDTFFGVLGADLAMTDFARFLRENQISENGVVSIVSDSGEVIAHPDSAQNVQVENGSMKPRMVQNLDDSPLSSAFEHYKKNKKNNFIFSEHNKSYVASFQAFPSSFPHKWLLAIVVPTSDFTGEMDKSYQKTIVISIIILLLSAFFISILSRRISRPITHIATELRRLQDFDMTGNIETTSRVREIKNISEALIALQKSLVSFGKFVPKKLVKKLVSHGGQIKLGGREKEVSLFFSDIESFTTISEGMSAEALSLHISEYFEELSQVIMDINGTIDKYIGDAIMAFWNAPLPDRRHSFNACSAALKCQVKLFHLNKKWTLAKKPVLHTRIGVHTHPVIVGTMGSEERMNYTVIGDAVNLAARLEGLNKVYKTKILVSQDVHDIVHKSFLLRPVDYVRVKGKSESVVVYELMAQLIEDPELLPTEVQIEAAEKTREAFHLFEGKAWKKAISVLEDILKKDPEDGVAQNLLAKCEALSKSNAKGEVDLATTMHLK